MILLKSVKSVEPPSPQALEEFRRSAEEIVGAANVVADEVDRYAYGIDASDHRGTPALVVRPGSAEEVSALLRLASNLTIPVVPRGGGTSLTGAVILPGGVVLDMGRFDRILEINPQSRYVRVEAGVVLDRLNRELKKHGLYLPVDPASAEVATVGGCVAENSGGPRGAKYGVVRNWILALEAVLAPGQILRLGERTLKNRAGYDILGLFVGSEGTLGVVTEATFKLTSLPKRLIRILARFNSLEEAGGAVLRVRGEGLTPTLLELLDLATVKAVNSVLGLGLKEAEATLIVDVEGDGRGVEEEAQRVEGCLKASGAVEVVLAEDEEEVERLYAARKGAYPAVCRTSPGVLTEDYMVPVERLPEAMATFKRIVEGHGLRVVVFGHAGDGNLHPNILFDPSNPTQVEKAWRAFEEIGEYAIRVGGSVSGEHGIGVDKAGLLRKQFEMRGSVEALRLMFEIKRLLDPKGIMNPGKYVELAQRLPAGEG